MSAFLRQQMNAILAPLLGALVAPVESMLRRLLRTLVLALAAFACLLATIVFASIAAYSWVASMAGTIIAALVLAGIYLVIAFGCLLAIWAGGRGRNARPAAAGATGRKEELQEEDMKAAAAAEAAQETPRSENIDRTIAPILAILQEAGLQRANVAVLLAAALAKQIRPLVLVATAFATGFAFGRRQ